MDAIPLSIDARCQFGRFAIGVFVGAATWNLLGGRRRCNLIESGSSFEMQLLTCNPYDRSDSVEPCFSKSIVACAYYSKLLLTTSLAYTRIGYGSVLRRKFAILTN